MITIEVNIMKNPNLAHLETIIGEFIPYLEKYIWKKLGPVAHSVAEEAKTYAPVKTGALRNSIVVVFPPDSIAVRCEVPYAKFQEYGTKYILPKMFLNSAMQNHCEEIRQVIEEIIQDYVKTVVA